MIDAYQASKPYIVRVMHLHEIDKAIRVAKGLRDFDPGIRGIWGQWLKGRKSGVGQYRNQRM